MAPVGCPSKGAIYVHFPEKAAAAQTLTPTRCKGCKRRVCYQRHADATVLFAFQQRPFQLSHAFCNLSKRYTSATQTTLQLTNVAFIKSTEFSHSAERTGETYNATVLTTKSLISSYLLNEIFNSFLPSSPPATRKNNSSRLFASSQAAIFNVALWLQ